MDEDFIPPSALAASQGLAAGFPEEDFIPPGAISGGVNPEQADEDRPSAIAEFARGAATAPVELGRGIGELAALGVDAAFDTDYVDDVSAAFDKAEDFIGAPTTGVGETTRDLLVFGAGFIPIAGWLGRAGQVAKTGKGLGAASKFMKSAEKFGESKPGKALLGNRAKVLGATALAGGVYDAVVSSSGRSTLSDQFEFLPEALKTEKDTGLTGREESYRQLRNRARQFAEATALGAAFDTALIGFGQGSRALGTAPVIGPALSGTARATLKGWDAMGNVVGRVPGAQTAKKQAVRFFAPGGGLDPRIRKTIQETEGVNRALLTEISNGLDRYDRVAGKVAKVSAKRAGRADFMKQMEQDVLRYLDAPAASPLKDKYGQEMQDVVDELVSVESQLTDVLIKNLEDIVAGSPTVSGKKGIPEGMIARGAQKEKAQKVLEVVKANHASAKNHLSRIYQLHIDPEALYNSLGGKNLMQSPQFKAAEDVLTRMKMTKGEGAESVSEEYARASAQGTLLEMLKIKPIGGDLSPEVVEKTIKNRLNTVREDVLGEQRGLVAQDTPIFKLETGILQEREDIMEYAPVRALLGEITSPRERLGYMLDNMATLNTSLRFYDQQARTAIPAAKALADIETGKRPTYVVLPGSARAGNVEQEFADLSLALGSGQSTENLLKEAKDKLRLEGYVQLGEESTEGLAGGRFGALSGMYVPKELYDSLTAPLQLNMNPISQLGAMLNQMKGLTQKMTIVPNPASRVRDIIGNKLMTVASGNTPTGFGLTEGQSLLTIYRGLQGLDQNGTDALARKLELAGVTDSNVLLKTLKSIQDEGPKFGAPEKLRGKIEALETKTPLMAPMLEFFEKTTQGADALAKARVLLSEEAKLRELVGSVADSEIEERAVFDFMERTGLVDRTFSEVELADPLAAVGAKERRRLYEKWQKYSKARAEKKKFAEPWEKWVRKEIGGEERVVRRFDSFEVAAADRTRKFMPTYSEIGLAVRSADRLLPFGNFTSFASENIRNMGNILEQGVKELAAQVDDELIAQFGQETAERLVRGLRAHGAQRLTGLLTVSSIVPKSMVRAGQEATGMTDEQMDRLHEQADYFQKGQDLVPLEFSGDGKIKYINLSYVAPYAFVTDAAQAALRGYQERGRLNQNEVEQIGGSVYDMIGALADPFASESIFFERVRDALPASGPGSIGIGRGGVTQTGARVYNPSDSLGTKVSQGFAHVLDSVLPAIIQLGGTGERGDLEPGRLTRAMTGTPGPRAREFNVAEEIGRQITGFTPMEIDLKKDAEFAAYEYGPMRSDAKKVAYRSIRRADTTPQDMINAWEGYLDSLYRSQSKLYNEILAYRELGLSDQQIRRNLIQKGNLGKSEVNAVMRGDFMPGLATDEIRKDVAMQQNVEGRKRVTTNVPWGELNRRSAQRRGERLDPELYRRRRQDEAGAAAPQPSPVAEEDFIPPGAVTAAPAAQPVPAAPATAAPAVAPATRQAPPQELLGGNLIDRMRNMEIFNRTQGQ